MPEKIGSSPVPNFSPDEPSSDSDKPLAWRVEEGLIHATALLLPCQQALAVAKFEMPDDGIAETMVDHFRLGESTPVEIDLDAELARNPRLTEFVAGRVEQELADLYHSGASLTDASGAVWVPQSAYGSTPAGTDQQLALGGTFFEYQAVASSDTGDLEVRLNVSDHYVWTPDDDDRTTRSLHECAWQMVLQGDATEFYQHGEGSLIVNDPRWGKPMTLLDGEMGSAR